MVDPNLNLDVRSEDPHRFHRKMGKNIIKFHRRLDKKKARDYIRQAKGRYVGVFPTHGPQK